MPETMDLVRTVIMAALAGLLTPVLVQLLLTLRSLQRSAVAVERKLDEALRELTTVVAAARQPPDTLSAVVAAVAPAVVAGLRAARAGHVRSANGAGEPHA